MAIVHPAHATAAPQAPVQGVLWMILSALTVALLGALAKHLEDRPASQILFFQMLVSGLVFGALLLREGRHAFATQHPWLHLVRGMIVFGAWYVYLVAVDDIPLMDAALLSNTVPLWVPFVAWVWLRQRPVLSSWGGILLGTVGMALVLHPSRPEVGVGTVLALASGMLGAAGFVAAGILCRTDSPLLVGFTGSLIAMAAATPVAAAQWQTPDPATGAVLVGIGLVFALGSYAATNAVHQAPAAVVTPMAYLSVVFTMLIDLVVWNDPPDVLSLVGTALVIAGGTWVVVVGQSAGPSPRPTSGDVRGLAPGFETADERR